MRTIGFIWKQLVKKKKLEDELKKIKAQELKIKKELLALK